MYILVKSIIKVIYLEEILKLKKKYDITYHILHIEHVLYVTYFLNIYLFVCACINITTTVVTDVVN